MDRNPSTRLLPTTCLGAVAFLFFLAAAASAAEPPDAGRYAPRLVTVESEAGRDRRQETGAPASIPFTADQPLSLASCVEIALDANPAVRVAREGVRIAEETAGEVRAAYYPELSARASYRRWETHAFLPEGLGQADIPSTVGPTDDWGAGFEARYLLFDSGARRARLAAARAWQDRGRQDERAVREDIALAVHEAYFGLVAAAENLGVAEQNLARAEDHLRLARERKEAGAVPQADVIRAQTEASDARLALVRAESLVRIARGTLNVAMGLPVTTELKIETGARPVVSPEDIDVAAAVERAVRDRSEIQAALRETQALRSRVAEAKSAFGPTVRLSAAYGLRDEDFWPEDEDWSAGATLELPLFTGFSRGHRVARNRAELARHEADTQRLVLDVQEEVWSSWSRLRESYGAIGAAEAQVEEAAESVRLTRERYGAGAGTVTDLLDAQTALARAEAQQVGARWDYHTARARYARSTGELAVPVRR